QCPAPSEVYTLSLHDALPICSVTQTGIVELMDEVGAPWPEAHSDPDKMAKLAIANYELSGLEAVRVPYCLTVLAEAMGCEVNMGDRKSTRLNSSHVKISYAVF